mgnify:CR=1 FL=1
MIKEENNNKQELLVRELGVFELRGLAREVGVPSPTTKKREELISLILQKFKDGMVVDPKRKAKGRPYKKLSSIEEIVSTMTNAAENNIKPMTYESIITFTQELPKFNLSDDDTTYVLEGIARQNEDYMLFCCEDKYVYIKDIDYAEKLRVGDKVKVEARSIGGKKNYIATKILSINKIETKNYQTKVSDNGEEIISNQTFPYGETKIFVGRRNAYLFKEDLYENDSFASLTKYCKENSINLLVLALNTSYENQIIFKNLEFENFTTPYGSSNIVNFNKVIDTINYAQNLIEHGENVIIFILDIVEVLRALDKCFVNEKGSEHCEQTIIIADKILSLGKAYKESSSTIVLGYNKQDKDEKYLNENILRISKKI